MSLKKIFLAGVFLLPSLSLAQGVDIPEFMDEDEGLYGEEMPTNNPPPAPIQNPVVNPTPTPVAVAPVAQTQNPNLGRNEKPIDKLIYSPPPLPELSIDLTTKAPEPVPPPKQWDPISVSSDRQGLTYLEEPNVVTGEANSLDARDYELEGFVLGMTPLDVGRIALEKGYKITKSQKEFPLFLTTRYEQECRAMGFRFPSEIRSCMRQIGQEDDKIFLKTMTITKPGNKESYFFEFTTPATENRAWRITYLNKGDNSLNFTQVNVAKKLARRDLFFQTVFNKFGYPSDSTNFIWGNKEDAFMQVSMYGSNYDAQITLTDTQLYDDDYFATKEWVDEQPPLETFDFGV